MYVCVLVRQHACVCECVSVFIVALHESASNCGGTPLLHVNMCERENKTKVRKINGTETQRNQLKIN